MQIWGKLLGFLFGFMFAKIPGALLGLFIGHMFDRGYSQDFNDLGGFSRWFSNSGQIKDQAIYFHTFFAVMGHIAKSKGRVTEQDIEVAAQLMSSLGLDKHSKKAAQSAFTQGKSPDFPLQDAIKELKDACHHRKDILLSFLEMQLQCLYVYGKPSDKQKTILLELAKLLGIGKTHLLALIHLYQAEHRFRRNYQQQGQASSSKDNLSDAYKILQLNAECTDAEVKKAYKKAMSKHHPDKLQAQGLPKETLELAKQKTQDISAAYELIKKTRGL